ncbi:MAG: hypothetical protein JXQ27_05615 [Acidobacteria bacterium]|nr:hypothetical protein [Acidobacteriota bacterium]
MIFAPELFEDFEFHNNHTKNQFEMFEQLLFFHWEFHQVHFQTVTGMGFFRHTHTLEGSVSLPFTRRAGGVCDPPPIRPSPPVIDAFKTEKHLLVFPLDVGPVGVDNHPSAVLFVADLGAVPEVSSARGIQVGGEEPIEEHRRITVDTLVTHFLIISLFLFRVATRNVRQTRREGASPATP